MGNQMFCMNDPGLIPDITKIAQEKNKSDQKVTFREKLIILLNISSNI